MESIKEKNLEELKTSLSEFERLLVNEEMMQFEKELLYDARFLVECLYTQNGIIFSIKFSLSHYFPLRTAILKGQRLYIII